MYSCSLNAICLGLLNAICLRSLIAICLRSLIAICLRSLIAMIRCGFNAIFIRVLLLNITFVLWSTAFK